MFTLIFGLLALLLGFITMRSVFYATDLLSLDPRYVRTMESRDPSAIWKTILGFVVMGFCAYVLGVYGWFFLGTLITPVQIAYARLNYRGKK